MLRQVVLGVLSAAATGFIILPARPLAVHPRVTAIVMDAPPEWQRDPDQWKREAVKEETMPASPADAFDINVDDAADEILTELEKEVLMPEDPVAVEPAAPPLDVGAILNDEEFQKAAKAVGELGLAAGMAVGTAIASGGIELVKMTGAATGRMIVSSVFGERRAPEPKEAAVKAVAKAVQKPVVVVKKAKEEAVRAPRPDLDVSLKATAARVKEAAALELEAATLQLEAAYLELADAIVAWVKAFPSMLREKLGLAKATTVKEIKAVPKKVRKHAIERVASDVTILDLELQSKIRQKQLLKKQLASGNEKLKQRLEKVHPAILSITQIVNLKRAPPPPPPQTAMQKLAGLFTKEKKVLAGARKSAPSPSKRWWHF